MELPEGEAGRAAGGARPSGRRRRRALGALGLVAAAAAAATQWIGPDSAEPVVRLTGQDRTAIAAAASVESFGRDEAGAVVLARSDAYADSLAGTPLAASRSAPLLLTGPAALDPRTENELRRVLPAGKTVYLLGQEGALAPAVERRLVELGYSVARYGGSDRYRTAVAVAEAMGNPPQLVLATGTDFPDALSGGAVAAALRGAVLLTDGSRLPEATRAYLEAHPAPGRYALGTAAGADPGAVAVVGTDRYDTSRLVAERFFPEPEVVGVAAGRDVGSDGRAFEAGVAWPPLLVGGAHVGRKPGPILLVDPDGLPDGVRRYLYDHRRSIRSSFVYGSPALVSPATQEAVVDLIT